MDSHTNTDAGLGARGWAFIIDWHIRVLLAVCAGGFLIWNKMNFILPPNWTRDIGFTLKAEIMMFVQTVQGSGPLAILIPLLIFVLYHPLIEIVFKGFTPGKWLAGIRVSNKEGNAPTRWQLLLRNIFRLIDMLPILYVIGAYSCFFSKSQIRLGDKIAGTKLIYLSARSS